MRDDPLVADLVSACHKLAAIGLGTSTSGNVSARVGEQVFLTPTGVSMGDVAADHLAIADLEGNVRGSAKPTKEMGFHLAIYGMCPQVAAVVHAHPTCAIIASTFLEADAILPAITPQFVMRAGRVPVAPYFPPGSPDLGDGVTARIGRNRAVLLQNHGAVTFGSSFKEAMGALEELEENCRQWLWTRQGGRVLSETEVTLLEGRRM